LREKKTAFLNIQEVGHSDLFILSPAREKWLVVMCCAQLLPHILFMVHAS